MLRAKPDENLAMIGDTIRFLKDHGKTVIYDAEHSFDGFKDEPEYALATWQAAEKAGAECIVLCDTNGGCLPEEIARITALAKGKLTVRLGIHTHNDCGMGVANALAGIEAGATQVQGTINGYGERTGNCNLISVIPLLHFKLKKTGVPANSLAKLKELSEFVDEIANVRHDPRQPWVGQTAFAHKGGMHAHAIDRVARSYEHIQPEAVGNYRRVLISDMSGRSNILMKARGARFQAQAGNAGSENHHAAHQGTGKPGLRVRGRRRLARVAHRQDAQASRTRCFTWTPITFPCVVMPGNPFVKRRSRSVSASGARRRWPKATAR